MINSMTGIPINSIAEIYDKQCVRGSQSTVKQRFMINCVAEIYDKQYARYLL